MVCRRACLTNHDRPFIWDRGVQISLHEGIADTIVQWTHHRVAVNIHAYAL